MINEKDKEHYKNEFGALMMRYAIVTRVIKDYEKELEEINAKLDKAITEIVGDKEDGKSVQQA